MASPDAPRGIDPAGYRRNLIAAALPTLLVPVAIGCALLVSGTRLEASAIGLGAVGWLLALALRAPVALVAVRTTGDVARAQPIITASSGPLEEVVRLAVLLLLGRDLPTALSIGLGWAEVEVVYSLINGVALLSLLDRDDEAARQARAMLPIPAAIEPSAPWWGVIERITASALHIGFTLIIAAQPLLVVVTAPVHSAVNLALLRMARSRSIARFEASLAVVALVVLAVAVALWR